MIEKRVILLAKCYCIDVVYQLRCVSWLKYCLDTEENTREKGEEGYRNAQSQAGLGFLSPARWHCSVMSRVDRFIKFFDSSMRILFCVFTENKNKSIVFYIQQLYSITMCLSCTIYLICLHPDSAWSNVQSVSDDRNIVFELCQHSYSFVFIYIYPQTNRPNHIHCIYIFLQKRKTFLHPDPPTLISTNRNKTTCIPAVNKYSSSEKPILWSTCK